MNITAFRFALSLFGLFFTFLPSLAAPGDLDTTFGGTGKIRLGLGSGSNRAHSVAVQPDGKIVAVGETTIGGYEQFAVLRYNADGTPDLTFGTGGIVTTNVGSLRCSANAVALQPDGKIVVAGYCHNGANPDFALARYNPNGSLDTTFSGDGKSITSLTSGDDEAADVVIQPDGKIIAVGYASLFSNSFAVVRYNSDGTFDTGFGNNGVVTTFSTSDARANAVALQPDGKIVVAGQGFNDFTVARYNPNGSLDTGFSGDGTVTTSSSSDSDIAYDVALQTDGKIVISGTTVLLFPPPTPNPIRTDFAVVRYNPDGELDTTFDGDGILTHFVTGARDSRAHSLAIQPDGKIVTAGYVSYSASGQLVFALVRYNPNGSFDTTFDGDGIALTVAGNFFSWAFAVALQTDGKIVAAGINDADFGNVALARYNADGSLDGQFGTGGIVSTDFGHTRSAAFAVVIQPDGKTLAAGYNNNGFALARFNVNGTLDGTFGTNGIVKTSNALGVNIIYAIAVQPDGKIVAAGKSITPLFMYHGFALARYNADGSLDTTFDGDGIIINYVGMHESEAHAVAIQPDGKIIAAGRTRFDFALVRYNSNGSLDTGFDGDGILTTDMGDNGDTINALALQPDGKIVAAGFKADSTTNERDSAVARYNPDGSLDTTFSGDGKVVTTISTIGNDDANGLVIQPDGKIITAGQAFTNNFYFALVRYNADGTLDNTFDFDGIVLTGFPPHGGFAKDVALQPDGKIVAAGNNGLYLDADFAITRYNPNGSPDNSFGTGGKVIFDIAFEDNVYALALDNLGRMIVTGSTGDLFTVMRLAGDVAPSTAMFDYDGDGKADISVFRPSVGDWYISRSSDGAFAGTHFGASGDLIAPADFDGDRKTDICVFRPSTGSWYRLNSSNNSFTAVQFGASGDLPTPGDFDGDGRADLTIFRPSAGSWYRLNSSNNQSIGVQFGVAEDKPIVGDFDGDGKSDLTVFRPSNGTWYRINSSNDSFSPNQFGATGDLPVAADYDGDGKTDLAVYRPSVGDWYIINSSNLSFSGIHFGITEDKPAPADYDGDGKSDFVVFRPSSGTWYLLRTTAGFTGVQFGAQGDIPTPNAFVR